MGTRMSGGLALICAACHHPGGVGVLWVSLKDPAIFRPPGGGEPAHLAHWGAVHDRCDRDRGRFQRYEIDGDRLTSRLHLSGWTGLLVTKTWLVRTDWADVLAEADGLAPPRRIMPVRCPV